MVHYPAPSVDVDNPLYCPSVSPTSYLESLQHQLRLTRARPRSTTRWHHRLLQSLARILEEAILADGCDSKGVHCIKNSTLENDFVHGDQLSTTSSSSSSEETLQPAEKQISICIPAWERNDKEVWNATLEGGNINNGIIGLKRKRETFSDFRGPSKYARSIQSVHDSSFDVSVKHERLCYSNGPGTPTNCNANHNTQQGSKSKNSINSKVRIDELVDELYGPPIGTESPQHVKSLVELLDGKLPGIRIKERLSRLPVLSHQSIIDFLGANGYLSSRTLALFRTSEIRWITLSESLVDVNGLNLCGDTLPIFSKPNSFLFLSELSLRDIRIHDFDLTHIQRLPKLSTLLLDNTSISNEAVFLLLPLKRSLKQLSIGSNPRINDDASPALILLSRLSFLSILDTGINMPGLRRLAKVIYDEDRIIDIEIPTICEEYIDGMHKKYLLHPRPPLITDPAVCAQLSTAALQRNLAAHAEVNPEIHAGGGKAEMIGRLRKLLEMRRMDMLIRDMIMGPGDEGGAV